MNNPIRATIQRHVEARRLLKMGGPVKNGTVLEIGCGRGVGVEIILDLFGAAHVDVFDLDPRMISRAKERLSQRSSQVKIWQGDAAAIAAPDNFYDAVFDFGIIHHVPVWRQALTEVHRVLKPHGRFYAEEIFARLITLCFARRLLQHPQVDRFNYSQFRDALLETGFKVSRSFELFDSIGWFVAEKIQSQSGSIITDPRP